MPFDPRIAIGGLFSLYGLILVAYGLESDAQIDLVWGGVLLVFGVGLLLVMRARRD